MTLYLPYYLNYSFNIKDLISTTYLPDHDLKCKPKIAAQLNVEKGFVWECLRFIQRPVCCI